MSTPEDADSSRRGSLRAVEQFHTINCPSMPHSSLERAKGKAKGKGKSTPHAGTPEGAGFTRVPRELQGQPVTGTPADVPTLRPSNERVPLRAISKDRHADPQSGRGKASQTSPLMSMLCRHLHSLLPAHPLLREDPRRPLLPTPGQLRATGDVLAALPSGEAASWR